MLWKKNDNPVREAKRKDLPRVTELRAQLHELYGFGRPDFFQKPFGEELAKETASMQRGRQDLLLIFEEDGAIWGYLHAVFETDSASLYRDARSYCSVRELCVDKSCRGQGIGTALMQALREQTIARGCPKIELQTWEFNAGALEFWQKQGFGTYLRCMEWKPQA